MTLEDKLKKFEENNLNYCIYKCGNGWVACGDKFYTGIKIEEAIDKCINN